MSNLWASTYDYPVAINVSNTVDDPNGPFSGLFITATGSVQVLCLNGPQNPITITAPAGTYIRWPIRRVYVSGTTAGGFGLVSAIVRQGP